MFFLLRNPSTPWRLVLPLAGLFMFAAAAGCKKQEPPAAMKTSRAAPGSAGPTPAAPPVDDAYIAVGKKLNAAIGCINSVSRDIYNSSTGYFTKIDKTKGPDDKMTVWIARFQDQNGEIEKLEAAMALTPATAELDAAMKSYALATKELGPLINEANDYYEKKANQDDKAVKGKELHPKLVAGFDKFGVAAKALADIVTKTNRQRKEAGLAKMAADPAAAGEYLFAKGLLVAEDIVNLSDVPFAKLDLAALTAKSDELEKSFAAIFAYAAAKTKPEIDGISSVESNMRDFVKSTVALVRRKKSDKAFEKYELDQVGLGHGDQVEGSSWEVIGKYNNLVNSANSR
jgi:hypothetical protein